MSRLLRSAVYFPVVDVDVSVDYFKRVLGFDPEYVAGTPSEFAIVQRDSQRIMLRRVAAPERIVPNEGQGGTWDLFVWVEGLDALFEELAGRGAIVVYGPVVQASYGMREFAVRTPDGYVIGFGESA